jgi:hypothetical protein
VLCECVRKRWSEGAACQSSGARAIPTPAARANRLKCSLINSPAEKDNKKLKAINTSGAPEFIWSAFYRRARWKFDCTKSRSAAAAAGASARCRF